MMGMARAGKLAFYTCSGFVQFPTSHLDNLVGATYDGVTEPKNVREAIYHWLFCEFVGGVGGVTTT